mmetsp:Transcript_33146/g.72254  ORF Transcript_33146/g.72254 Transcript_33146/m.72254 type:complete len:201 (-) Transcript_33146:352-954(-)
MTPNFSERRGAHPRNFFSHWFCTGVPHVLLLRLLNCFHNPESNGLHGIRSRHGLPVVGIIPQHFQATPVGIVAVRDDIGPGKGRAVRIWKVICPMFADELGETAHVVAAFQKALDRLADKPLSLSNEGHGYLLSLGLSLLDQRLRLSPRCCVGPAQQMKSFVQCSAKGLFLRRQLLHRCLRIDVKRLMRTLVLRDISVLR